MANIWVFVLADKIMEITFGGGKWKIRFNYAKSDYPTPLPFTRIQHLSMCVCLLVYLLDVDSEYKYHVLPFANDIRHATSKTLFIRHGEIRLSK